MTDFIPPRYRVVAIDETEHWAADIVAITGRIAGVYIVNFAECVHICSFRDSYWAEFVCNITEHYIRDPDGYDSGVPIWDDESDDAESIARGKALVAVWNDPQGYYGIQYEGASESSMYLDEGFPEPANSLIDMVDAGWDQDPATMSDDDAEEYRRQRDKAAQEAVQEYMNNGEEWQDIAPWNVQVTA